MNPDSPSQTHLPKRPTSSPEAKKSPIPQVNPLWTGDNIN